jgi:hypothetical protein
MGRINYSMMTRPARRQKKKTVTEILNKRLMDWVNLVGPGDMCEA